MASPKLALPFVVTLAAASMACSGTAVVTDDGGGGSGGSSSNSTSNGSTSTSGGSSSSTVNPTECPAEAPGPFEACTPSSAVCNYDVSCQSGVVDLQFSCPNGTWELTPTPCDLPHDSCPGTEYHCIDNWQMPMSTNPPSPCPDAPPTAGNECFAGGMGGIWDKCGYRCDDTPEAAWTIATCPTEPSPSPPTWEYDGACLD